MPIVSVDVYHSIKELITSSSLNIYYHYFIAANVIDNNFHFFENKKRKTIILYSSPKAKSLFNGYHTLYTGYPEKELIKSILSLEQTAHAEGKNLPKIEIQDKQLSPREIEVITLIVKGYINKEIADRLNIGLTTVITHRRNIMNKLNLKSISALTIYAVTHGYVSINEI